MPKLPVYIFYISRFVSYRVLELATGLVVGVEHGIEVKFLHSLAPKRGALYVHSELFTLQVGYVWMWYKEISGVGGEL